MEHQALMDRELRLQPSPVPDVRVMYSGLDAGALVMGDAILTEATADSLSLRGDEPVRPGMDMTLLVFLPGSDEPVGIAESRVTNVRGTAFRVELRSTALLSMAELQQHLQQAMARQPAP